MRESTCGAPYPQFWLARVDWRTAQVVWVLGRSWLSVHTWDPGQTRTQCRTLGFENHKIISKNKIIKQFQSKTLWRSVITVWLRFYYLWGLELKWKFGLDTFQGFLSANWVYVFCVVITPATVDSAVSIRVWVEIKEWCEIILMIYHGMISFASIIKKLAETEIAAEVIMH